MPAAKRRKFNAEATVPKPSGREAFSKSTVAQGRSSSKAPGRRNILSNPPPNRFSGNANGPPGRGKPFQSQKFRGRGGAPPHAAPSRQRQPSPPNLKRVSKQREIVEIGPFLDLQYLRSITTIPSKEDYPQAKKDLFMNENQHKFLQKIFIQNGGDMHVEFKELYRKEKQSGQIATFRCTIKAVDGTDNVVEVNGDGLKKVDSKTAATRHLLAVLHQSGALSQLLIGAIALDGKYLEDEKDAIVDVYNYAAKYGLLPDINITSGPPGNRHAQVRITLPQHSINVQTTGPKIFPAVVATCVKFKRQAEVIQAENRFAGVEQSGLNLANANTFLDFYKSLHPRADIDVTVEQTRKTAVGSGGMEAQVSIESEPINAVMTGSSKKITESLANLVLAITLAQRNPTLTEAFENTAKTSKGEILGQVRPIDASIAQRAINAMDNTVYAITRQGKGSQNDELIAAENVDDIRKMRERPRLSDKQIERRSKELEHRLTTYSENPGAEKMTQARASLPMNQHKQRVLDHVNKHAYSVIIGATGSGKTTQVPQILLEQAILEGKGAACDIVCTQPRRIAATSVARRVADERLEKLQDTVGYHVRFDAKLPRRGGSITYCTTGILLQQIQHASDEVFDTTSAIIIDEVHERDILIDFLLNLIRRTAINRRAAGKPVPKIILMSATIDSKLFAQYFEAPQADGTVLKCPSLSIPGRTFPVETKYYEDILSEMNDAHGQTLTKYLKADDDTTEYTELETNFQATNQNAEEKAQGETSAINWKRERRVKAGMEVDSEAEDAIVPINLVAATISHIAKTTSEGAMLVFLPGYDEMKKTREALEQESPLGVNFNNKDSYRISLLHSSVPANEQAEVFKDVPAGCRKVILSTNIAETSVTIPDVQYVIDTGKLREKRYDQIRRITKLQCTWISKSNSKQRAGRAGRVQNGNYYALYSKARFESLRAIGLPEMLRSDLQEICLDVKAHDFGASIREFLADSIEAPDPRAVKSSIETLKSLQALGDDESLTALGRLLASLPVHPSLGKMIVLGVIFRCLDPMVILGAALNERGIFVAPPEKRQEARKQHEPFAEGTGSDHIALINAIRQVRLTESQRGWFAARDMCFAQYLHYGAYKVIKSTSEQIEDVLVEAGLIPRVRAETRGTAEIGSTALNTNSKNTNMILAIALAGLQPNIAFWQGNMLRAPTEKNTMIHPGSISAPSRGNKRNQDDLPPFGTLCTFSTMQKSNDGNNMFLREISIVSPLMALLFGGRYENEGRVIRVDGWLPFFMQTDRRGSSIFLRFRGVLDTVLAKAFDSLSALKKKSKSRSSRTSRSESDQIEEEEKYLADDRDIETLAKGLVNVLDFNAATPPQENGGTESFMDLLQRTTKHGKKSAKRKRTDFDDDLF